MAQSRVFIAAAALLALVAGAHAALAQVAVRAEVVHTMAGPALRDAVIIVTDGKIAAVGPADTTPIPDGYRVLTAAIATPGLIDARATVGLSGLLNQRQDQDQLDRSAPIQPELRAIDAYNPLDPLVAYLRSFGITAVNTGHAPGELVSGQTAVLKTAGDTVDIALVRDATAVVATFGPSSIRGSGSPGTRAKQIAMLRQELLTVRADVEKRARDAAAAAATPAAAPASSPPATPAPDSASPAQAPAPTPPSAPPTPPERNLRTEALASVLSRDLPLIITAHRSQDIASALRIAREFNIRLILDGAAEAHLLTDEIKAAGVDVILHPTMYRATGEAENLSFETAATLHAKGIRFAIQSGYEAYVPKTRVVLLEAGVAAGNGLPFDAALASITIDAARILGVSDRLGSLEVGKDGDIALYSGDPFEYTARCVAVVIDGAVVSDSPR
jgi:imidazolonepropionase-like amidohydrolase